MKPVIGITVKHLNKSTTLLTKLLADEMMLYIKTRKFHWNVTGESFMELHKLYEQQYKQLESTIDEIAERIGKLGEKTIGTMKEFEKLSTIKESPGEYPETKKAIAELLHDHETLIIQLRKDVEEIADNTKDAGTADFMTGIMEEHETTAWILRRYIS
ncbi:MAG: DNA starvation/stationary phase protection protein [Chitinophagales bacterium]|nr:DNA starvation/stationary phase protection protein [Bacteroidota bacterium]